MKHLIVLMLFLAAISGCPRKTPSPSRYQNHPPIAFAYGRFSPDRLGATGERHFWAIEPMVGLRYVDYWNERDLRFSPSTGSGLHLSTSPVSSFARAWPCSTA